MVFIDILQDDGKIKLDCHKNDVDGEYFRLVIDKATQRVIERPELPDIDATVAYSHIFAMLKAGEPLPDRTVAEWG